MLNDFTRFSFAISKVLACHFPVALIPAMRLHCRFCRRGVKRMEIFDSDPFAFHFAVHGMKWSALKK